jgi:vanillate O-demethylase monooxygenase subunit
MDLDSRGFDLLRRTWQPVARSADLPPGAIRSYTLLDEDLVIARLDPQSLLAARDRCPHRGARFGIGDVHDGQLRCPYHGWTFDGTGSCTAIPSLADPAHPARAAAGLQTYDVRERYGLI